MVKSISMIQFQALTMIEKCSEERVGFTVGKLFIIDPLQVNQVVI